MNHRKLGERGLAELEQINNSVPFIKREKMVKSTKDMYLQTAEYTLQMPPMLLWNQVELKLSLEDLCGEFEIKGDMEIDDGNSFSY